MTKDELLQVINNYLKPLGYRKKERSWYKENPKTITVFSLIRSRWGETYYVSLGVNFKDLSDEKRPKSYQCHGRLRAEYFGENTEEYLKLEKDMDENVRKQRIKQLVDKSLPILSKMETTSGFKELLKQFNPRLFALGSEERTYLGINIP